MKILITTDAYHAMINGVAISVKTLCAGLKEAGHDVRVLTLSQNKDSYIEENVYAVKSWEFKIYPEVRVTCSMGKNIFRDICAWRPDVIHSQSEFSTFLFARRIARELHIPIVHTYHTLYESYTHYFCPSKKLGKEIVSKISKSVCNQAELVIAPTDKIKDLLKGYKVEREIRVVPTGLELERFQLCDPEDVRIRMREAYGISDEAKVLVYLGRVAYEKNIEFLIRQMVHQELFLFIIGDGPDKVRLEKLVDELGLNQKVIFTGMVHPSETPNYYRLGDVFVSASTSETQGLTYIEAMASGLPLLCKKDLCLEQVLINGKNGYFFEEEKGFEEDLKQIFCGKEALSRLHKEALLTSKRFTKTSFAKEAVEAYQTAIQLKGGEKCIPFECIPKLIWRKVMGY